MAKDRDSWYEEKVLIKKAYEAVRGKEPGVPASKERLLAAHSGLMCWFHKEWVGKFPIQLSDRDAGIKRKVRCSVTSWTSIGSLGAVHWYGEVKEEDAEVFLPREFDQPYPPSEKAKDRWVRCDLPDGSNEGRECKGSLMERIQAERYVLALLRFVFKPETHEHSGSFGDDLDEVFKETKMSDPRVVLPVTPMENAKNLAEDGRRLSSPVKVGDLVEVEVTDGYEWFMANVHAVKSTDSTRAIGVVTEIIHSCGEARRDGDHFEQYFATVDTRKHKPQQRPSKGKGRGGKKRA